MKKIWTNRRGFLTAGFVILYLAVNIFILYRMSRLKEYADIITVSFQAGSVTEAAFDQWRENADSKVYMQAAVWKSAGECMVRSEDTGRSRKISCYRMKGQPEAVWGRELAEGRYFTEGEEQVCLLDQYTARQLFGSDKAAGLTVQMDGSVFRIAGVLRGDSKVCVVLAGKDEVFDGAAVCKRKAGQSSDQAAGTLETAFGVTGGQRADGQLYYASAGILYVGITSVILLSGSILLLRRRGRAEVILGLFGLAAAAGVLILGAGMVNPGSDYLPTYWSDFEFFTRLLRDKTEQIKNLSVHQEFPALAEMIGNWRQIIEAELLMVILALSRLMRFGKVKIS